MSSGMGQETSRELKAPLNNDETYYQNPKGDANDLI